MNTDIMRVTNRKGSCPVDANLSAYFERFLKSLTTEENAPWVFLTISAAGVAILYKVIDSGSSIAISKGDMSINITPVVNT